MNGLEMGSVLSMPMVEVQATCEHHGDYLATVIVRNGHPRPAECAMCQQEIIQRERDEESRQQLETLNVVRRKKTLERIELPVRMESVKWSDYKPPTKNAEAFLNLCKRYADHWYAHNGHTGNIAMVGKTGTGKTHLACMIAKQVAIQSRANVLYTTVARMSRYIRASFGKQCEYSQTEAFERYVKLDLLVLDEIGLNLSSGFERALLDELVDERSMRRAPTIMISNLHLPELEQMAERLMDRMRENGQTMVFDWDSHRGSKS